MTLIIILVHVFVCVALILIVLLQRGKGADMGAAFGGSSQAIFGSTGATTFLHKMTTIIAVVFMLTSLGLSFLFGKGSTTSIMDKVSDKQAPVAADTQTPTPSPAPAGETQEKK
jgi:preprotein translocase subunit SecG